MWKQDTMGNSYREGVFSFYSVRVSHFFSRRPRCSLSYQPFPHLLRLIPPSLHAFVPGVVTSNSPTTPSALVWSGSVLFSFLFFSVHVCVYWVMMIHKKRKLNSRLWNGTLRGKAIQHELQLRHANMRACHERVVLSTQTPSTMGKKVDSGI